MILNQVNHNNVIQKPMLKMVLMCWFHLPDVGIKDAAFGDI